MEGVAGRWLFYDRSDDDDDDSDDNADDDYSSDEDKEPARVSSSRGGGDGQSTHVSIRSTWLRPDLEWLTVAV